MFLERIQNIFLAPRVWLSAGVFSFGVSVILGYHQDQIAAQKVLTTKVDMPETILIQDFDPGKNSNMLNEVHVLAEAALTQIAAMNIGSDDFPNWVQVVPIYPVGAASKPFAEQYFAESRGDARRPMPRANRENLRSEASRLKPLEDQPMGLVLIEFGKSLEETILYKRVGDGMNGPLVVTTGSILSADDIAATIHNVFASEGVSVMKGIPIVVPYPRGGRVVGSEASYEWLQDMMQWAALAFVFIGLTHMFPVYRRRNKKPTEVFQKVEAVGALPEVFQAIRTQEELVLEEQAASERAAAATRRKLSRLNYG